MWCAEHAPTRIYSATRMKQSDARIGLRLSEETKAKMSAKRKLYYQKKRYEALSGTEMVECGMTTAGQRRRLPPMQRSVQRSLVWKAVCLGAALQVRVGVVCAPRHTRCAQTGW